MNSYTVPRPAGRGPVGGGEFLMLRIVRGVCSKPKRLGLLALAGDPDQRWLGNGALLIRLR